MDVNAQEWEAPGGAFLQGYMTGFREGVRCGQARGTYGEGLLALPMEELELSQGCLDCLEAYGCRCIEDVVLMGEEAVAQIRSQDAALAAAIARGLQEKGIGQTQWSFCLP